MQVPQQELSQGVDRGESSHFKDGPEMLQGITARAAFVFTNEG
jgi:hypothetical protein